MQFDPVPSVTGFVFRVEGKRKTSWYAKYRLADGRQVKKRIGPAWQGKGHPAPGFVSKRTAERWLDDALAAAREQAPSVAAVDATFAEAAREWLRYVEHDRGGKPSTLRSYRSSVEGHFVPVFGEMAVQEITSAHIERWRASMTSSARTRNKLLTELSGIFARAQRVYGLPSNPVAGVERLRAMRTIDVDVFSPEEVWALVRGARSAQDAALFLTAAFTGLRRGELLALRWRDVDFPGSLVRVRASYCAKKLTTPKSGKIRSVPMARDVAAALARLRDRDRWTGDEDLVFPGLDGDYLDGSALRRRYLAALSKAGLRRLRFHDLRHTFGTAMIGKADILRVKEWMGHADVQTTMRYLHFAPRPDDARLVTEAFEVTAPISLDEHRAAA